MRTVNSLAALGIVAVSISAVVGPELMSFVFGRAFEAAGGPFVILMVTVGILAVSGTISTAVIAYKGDSNFSVAVCIAGLVASVVTLILVPYAGALGAAIGALSAEITILVLMTRQYRILSERSLQVAPVTLLVITALSVGPALAFTLLYSSGSFVLTLIVGFPGWLLASVLALRVRPGREDGSGPIQKNYS